mgnify:CR=1 FL=1
MARSFLDSWLNRLKTTAREEIQETARSAAYYLALYGVAAAAGLIAVVFLTLAVFWWMASELSAPAAALVIAAFYVVLAAVILIWASWSGETTAVSGPPPEQEVPRPSESGARDMPSRMGVDLDSVASTLADAGFRTESLVVSTSSQVLRQLTPLQFVGLVFVASFLFGRRLRR